MEIIKLNSNHFLAGKNASRTDGHSLFKYRLRGDLPCKQYNNCESLRFLIYA
jgi:hypothetical protein